MREAAAFSGSDNLMSTELYKKNIFSSTPITSFSLFLSYIVVTPLILGFEKDFLCHFHLGLIWISLLFSFLSAPFFSK